MTRKDLKTVLRDTLHPMGRVHDRCDGLDRVIDEVTCEIVEAARKEEPKRETVPPAGENERHE